jgi:hypothetical protein
MQRYIEDRIQKANNLKIGPLPAEVVAYTAPAGDEDYARVKLKFRANFKGVKLPEIDNIPVGGVGGVYPLPVGTRGITIPIMEDAYGLIVDGDDPSDLEVNEFSGVQTLNNCIFIPVFTRKASEQLASADKVFEALNSIEEGIVSMGSGSAVVAYVPTLTDKKSDVVGSSVRIGG